MPRTALVVEGSHVYHRRTQADLLEELWRAELSRAVGYPPPDHVFGISKGSVAAMRLERTPLRRTTSIAEPLDQILERLRRTHDVQCFLVAWDLLPPWDRTAGVCRWMETLAFYEGLSLSAALDRPFRDFAAARFAELRRRRAPALRGGLQALQPGAVLAVCLEPLFESAFVDERAMKRSLGVVGHRLRHWPVDWDPATPRADRVVAAAIDSARGALPHAPVFRRIPEGYRTAKTEWGIHFARSRHFDRALRASGFGRRLAEFAEPH